LVKALSLCAGLTVKRRLKSAMKNLLEVAIGGGVIGNAVMSLFLRQRP